MSVLLPLETMSATEKINVMETIWKDLCKTANAVPSLVWHEKTLKKRDDAVEQGNDKFIDWEEFKKNVINDIL